jgi:glycosyltransferase involved in cell wall biosynthesis
MTLETKPTQMYADQLDLGKILTIGIPTFNRPEKLRDCLESVLIQEQDDVEILVCDNSENNLSKEIVNELNKKYKHKTTIHYHKNETNVGIDRNFYNLVKYGTGEYIEWLSDDDELLPGAVKRIVDCLRLLDEKPTFLFLNPIGFIQNGSNREWKNSFLDIPENLDIDEPERAIDIFDHYITYISSYCFHRRSWLENCTHERFFGTNLYLTYALIKYLSLYRKVIILREPTVAHRYDYTGNFPVLRPFTVELRNAMLTYSQECNLDKTRLKKTYERILKQHIFKILLGVKLGYFKDILKYHPIRDVFIPSCKFRAFWYKLLPVLIIPSLFFKIARKLKSRVKYAIGK